MSGEVVPRFKRQVHGDPVQFLHRWHPNISRGKLILIDPSLRKALKTDGKLEVVQKTNRDLSDPIAVWRKEYPNKSLLELHSADIVLYQTVRRLLKKGKLKKEDLPQGSNLPKFTQQFRDNWVAFAKAYYPGVRATELAQLNWALFCKIRDSKRLAELGN